MKSARSNKLFSYNPSFNLFLISIKFVSFSHLFDIVKNNIFLFTVINKIFHKWILYIPIFSLLSYKESYIKLHFHIYINL